MFNFSKDKVPSIEPKKSSILKTMALLTMFSASCSNHEKANSSPEYQQKNNQSSYQEISKLARAGGSIFMGFEIDSNLRGTFGTMPSTLDSLTGEEIGYNLSLQTAEMNEARENKELGNIKTYVSLVDSNADGRVDQVLEQYNMISKWDGANYESISFEQNEVTDPQAIAEAQKIYSAVLPFVARLAATDYVARGSRPLRVIDHLNGNKSYE